MAREAAEQDGGAAPGAPLEARRGARRAGHRRAREHAVGLTDSHSNQQAAVSAGVGSSGAGGLRASVRLKAPPGHPAAASCVCDGLVGARCSCFPRKAATSSASYSSVRCQKLSALPPNRRAPSPVHTGATIACRGGIHAFYDELALHVCTPPAAITLL